MAKSTHLYAATLAALLLCSGCGQQPQKGAGRHRESLSVTDAYTVTGDSVIQGPYTATALSPTQIVSDYSRPEPQEPTNVVKFRLSINSRDNEMPQGMFHYALVGADSTVSFGTPQAPPDTIPQPLPHGTRWRVNVDVSQVLGALRDKGLFVTATGDTIHRDDFKGIWITGDTPPLSWDCDDLELNDRLRLRPTAKKGIYSLTLTLNPTSEAQPDGQTGWSADEAADNSPQVSSAFPLVDAAYNMAMADIASCRRDDGTFASGPDTESASTRDAAMATYLALACLDPDGAMATLKRHTSGGRVIQDQGTGGSWPVSTDRVAWIAAAWEIYKATGDRDWLSYAYETARRSIEDDRLVSQNHLCGLMHGQAAWFNAPSQSYPEWMEPKDIYASMSLSTNALFAYAFRILSYMANELGTDTDYYSEAKRLKDAINQNLWQESKGRYAAYLYGGIQSLKAPLTDNLGQALCVLFDIADDGRTETLMERTPVTDFGTPLISPRIADAPASLNDAVWPFEQALWNMAAAKAGNETALRHGMAALYRAQALSGTTALMTVASTGHTTAQDGARLSNAAGCAAMTLRVLAGIELKTRGIEFNPSIPESLGGVLQITGFKYRNATLDITIGGSGNVIEEVRIDGTRTDDNFFPANLKGPHSIAITMRQSGKSPGKITLKPIDDLPPTPTVARADGRDTITDPAQGVRYALVTNGKTAAPSDATAFPADEADQLTTAAVIPFRGDVAGFMSRPATYAPDGNIRIYQCEDFATPGSKHLKGKNAKNFVELTADSNTDISIPVMAPVAGVYYIDVKYANGNGPASGGGSCAVRMLCVNTHLQGAIVMPTRGRDEWLNTGYSNALRVELLTGKNVIQLIYAGPSNQNMDGGDNSVLIDHVRIIKK